MKNGGPGIIISNNAITIYPLRNYSNRYLPVYHLSEKYFTFTPVLWVTHFSSEYESKPGEWKSASQPGIFFLKTFTPRNFWSNP